MKKIIFVCFNADHPRTGYAVRVYRNIEAVVSAGVEVSVLRLVPAFHGAESWKSALAGLGVRHCLEVPVPPISRYWLSRAVFPLVGWLWLWAYSRFRGGTSCVIAEGHEAAGAVLWHKQGRVIVDLHGAAPEEVEFSRKLTDGKGDSFCLWLNRVEKKIIDRADHILIVAKKMREHLAEKWGVESGENISVVPIYLDVSGVDAYLNCHRQNGNVFVYSGGAQGYQCIKSMLTLFCHIKRIQQDASLLILTPDVDIFEREIANVFHEKPDFISIKSVNHGGVIENLKRCNYGFVLRSDETLNKVSCPTKINEYLAAGLMVICTQFSGHGPSAIEETDAGVVVSLSVDSKEAELLVEKLAECREKYEGSRVSCYLQKFSQQSAAATLVKIVKEGLL